MAERLTSTTNPRIKALARLRERKGRVAAGRFLIEGHRELTRAADASIPILEVVLAPELAAPRDLSLVERLAVDGAEVVEVGRAAFEKLSFRRHPDGVLGVALSTPLALGDLEVGNPAFVLVLDGIEKPGNLGGIIRSADAAGVDAVILVEPRCEAINPSTIRASQGSVFSLPICTADAAETNTWITHRGLHVVAASPEATTALWDADLTGDIAAVVGAEAEGIGPVFRSPDTTVRIPMAGTADSLNASVSAGILLFEVVRQRSL